MRKGKVRILILTALLLGAAVLGTAQKPPGVPVTYELSIVIEGSGTVTVNPPPLEGETSFTGNARINYSHPEGESITVGLQAEPAAGYAFVRWVLRKPDGSTTTVGSSTTNMELYYDEAWGTFSEWSARAEFIDLTTFQVRRTTGDVIAPGAYHGKEFITKNGDLAEWVPVTEEPKPGHVLEIDPEGIGQYRLARGPCSVSVAGVVSTTPGMVLGSRFEALSEDQALLALLGVVPVKVSDEGGPITIGDLLTVSSTPGYAMRWDPDSGQPCALVGKALESLHEGSGKIKILLTR